MANEPVFDCGKFKALIVRQVPDGRGGVVAERIMRARHVMGLDPSGNVAPIKTHNSIANRAQMDPYAMTILQCKWASGWVPYLECPQGAQHARWLPANLQGRQKCRAAADGSPIGRDRNLDMHPCECIVALEAIRKGVQKSIEDNRAQDKTDQQRILEATERQNALLVQAVGAMAGVSPTPQAPKAAK